MHAVFGLLLVSTFIKIARLISSHSIEIFIVPFVVALKEIQNSSHSLSFVNMSVVLVHIFFDRICGNRVYL